MSHFSYLSIRAKSAKLSALLLMVVVCPALVIPMGPSFAQEGESRLRSFLEHSRNAIHNQVTDVKMRAMSTYLEAPRSGSCAERRENYLGILPDALRLGRYARDIYTNGHDDEMEATNVLSMNLGNGRTAYRDSSGKRYAEVQTDISSKEAIVIFRGTRLTVGSDISTDIGSHIGIETAYYKWAAELVRQTVLTHPGLRVVVTGQSLGGGLTLYAVLRNPGVTGFAFNPAGLSLVTWLMTKHTERERMNSSIVVVSTRNDDQIEPVTALSFAGRSVIPGHIFMIKSDVTNDITLHGSATIVSTLEQIDRNRAAGSVCEGDIGVLARN